MSRQVSLGGDRLGSGNKQKVTLQGYERSTHDRGYIFRTTMSAGTLVPFIKQVALPGDTFDIHLDCDVKTHPTIGPLFGSFKVQLDVFYAPIRLYQGDLHNNKLGIGMKMNTIQLPIAQWYIPQYDDTITDIDNYHINPSCILAYLGIRGFGINPETTPTFRRLQIIPLLATWEIYKNYYANKQEEIGAVIHASAPPTNITAITINNSSGGTTLSDDGTIPSSIVLDDQTYFVVAYSGGTAPDPTQIFIYFNGDPIPLNLQQITWNPVDDGSSLTMSYQWNDYGTRIATYWTLPTTPETPVVPRVVTFPLSNIDEMRNNILWAIGGSGPFNISNISSPLTPYSYVAPADWTITNLKFTQEGLPVKTYQSDIFNNWLNTDWIDGTGGITELSSIDVSGGILTMDSLNIAQKVYELLNRIAVSGGTYNDWINAAFDQETFLGIESPMYMGGLIKELIFQEVVSNSGTNEQNTPQPLGTLAGKGILSNKHKGGYINIKCAEPAYIMGYASLTPRIDYSQGNDWDTYALTTMDSLHKPGMDEIGFQELITEQMAWWDTHYDVGLDKWVQKSAGKQPAWLNYMTATNKVLGNFAIASNEMFMTLNRRYEPQAAGSVLEIKDLTTYIDPAKFNNIFAQTSLDAQNFWMQIAVDITYRGKISARLMPNL